MRFNPSTRTRFNPSALSGGLIDAPYSTRVGLTTYRHGQHWGDPTAVQSALVPGKGFDAGGVISAGAQLATVGVQLGLQASQAKKQREHRKELARLEQKTMKQQAAIAAASAQADSAASAAWMEVGKTWGMWLGLALVVGVGAYAYTKRR